MISTETAADQRIGQPRLRPEDSPDDEGDERRPAPRPARTQPETRSARPWIGARLRWALAPCSTICASSVSRADPLGAHDEAAVPLRVPPVSRRRPLFDRHRLAGQHRFVDRGAALDDDAVDRHRLAGPHAQAVADLHLRRAARRVSAPSAPSRRAGLRRKVEQRADRRAGPLARAQLEHLAEQDQRDDHRRGLEIDADRAVHGRGTACGNSAGNERRDDAVEIGGADAEADQRPHVRAAVDERFPAALEERQRRPQHHRRGQRELEPAQASAPTGRAIGNPTIGPMAISSSGNGKRAR